jgi:hypothetical protein
MKVPFISAERDLQEAYNWVEERRRGRAFNAAHTLNLCA